MLSIPVIVMASISFYAGFYHLLIYARSRYFRAHLTFSTLCFAVVAYDVFCIGLYHATSVVEGVEWQRLQFMALALFVPAFLWFVSDYTNQKPGPAIYVYSVYYTVAFLVQLIDRSNLTFLVDQPAIKNITLLGFDITYYEVALGPFSSLQSFMGLIASASILMMGFRYFKNGHKSEAAALILATGLMYAAAIHDTLVGNGFYQFIYLMEYAYLATILMMTSSLSRTVVDAAVAKEELKKREEWFRSLVETTSDWVWEVDATGKYTYASPKVRELLGYAPEEVIGHTPFDFMSPNDSQNMGMVFQNIIQNLGVFERLENINLRKDGQPVILETSGIPFFGDEGELLGYRGIDRDVTERKKAEVELRASEERYRRLVEVSPIPMWINKDGLITYMNPAALKVLGATHLEQVVGKVALSFVHPDYHETVKKRISQMLDEEKIAPLMEEKYVRLDGQAIDVEVIATPFAMSGGRAMQVLFQDITRRKQTEAEREALIADLEAKNAELERFTYTVSHDLKSPLVTIKGFLGYIEQDALTGNIVRLKSDLRRISDAVERMRLLLNDLLELSRIGRFSKPLEEIPFGELAHEALGLVDGSIQAHHIAVNLQADLSAVYGDRQRLVEALQNLLDNASKFMGDRPDPCIEIGQAGKENENPIFFVKDNGIGFAPEYREHVFGLFNKLDPKTEGSGIGLALVKRIIEIHGGRVWVESEKGKGATFYFTLPRVAKGS